MLDLGTIMNYNVESNAIAMTHTSEGTMLNNGVNVNPNIKLLSP